MNRISRFYRISAPAPAREMDRGRPRQILPPPAHAGLHRRHARLQPLLRLPDEPQRDEETDSRQRLAGRLAAGRYRLGAAVRLCHRQIRQRIHRRLLQHQTLHGHRPDRLCGGQHADGRAGADALGHPHGRDLRRVRRDVGPERLVAVDGRRPGDHLALALVSAERAGDLLRFLLGEPQPRGVLLVPVRGFDRDLRRLAGGLLRLGR